MTLVSTRLATITAVLTATVLVTGLLTFQSFKDLEDAQDGIRNSFLLDDSLDSIAKLQVKSREWNELKSQTSELLPDHRKDAWDRIWSAGEQKYGQLLRERVVFARSVEKEYRRYLTNQIPYLKQKVTFYFVILFASVLIGVIGLFAYTKISVFRPLETLSRKMTDFLNDRYTYQFSLPPANEIGNLQATFNSLAQRVLANMEELKNLDNAKSEFLSIASHELRTPLTSIKGSLSLLRSGVIGNVSDTVTGLLQIAEIETDRLIRLINELLDLAKIEAGRFEVELQWRSVTELVEKTMASLQGLSQAAQVRLSAADTAHIEAHMDFDRVQQVLTNLISNAIKFSPKGSQIEIKVDPGVDGLLFQIVDHGRGIAPEDQELIFHKFRQATNTKNPLVKGTGLGLSIAKALVEEHGGKVGLTSKPGEGSTFYFTLPQWRYALNRHGVQRSPGVAA